MPHISKTRICRGAVAAFAKEYFLRGGFAAGKKGLIASAERALASVMADVKIWEYDVRRKEGNAILPPADEAQVRILSERYARWRE
jgi:hypothetical protein